jgi:hypothetical protein
MLKVCILGNTKSEAEKILESIYHNDIDSKPIKIQRDRVVMDDGTQYYALSNTQGDIRGRQIDQLIISNNYEVKNDEQHEAFEYAKYRLYYSNVPDEFQIQVYK